MQEEQLGDEEHPGQEDEQLQQMQAAFEPLTHNSFPTRDELLSTVRAAAQSVGFGVSIERSTANRKVLLKCDFGGEYRDFVKAPDGAKRRRTSTRLNGCPFQLLGKCVGAIWSANPRSPPQPPWRGTPCPHHGP